MFTLKSTAFEEGGTIPEKYAEKSNISPPLSWENAPKGTQSFALAVTDPDLPEQFNFPRNFIHWAVYNIAASISSIPEGASPGGEMPAGSKELNSDFVTFQIPGYSNHYGGPWPPDASHRYVFTLYALKSESLDLPDGADFSEFAQAVLPVAIMTATLVGYYGPAKDPLPGS